MKIIDMLRTMNNLNSTDSVRKSLVDKVMSCMEKYGPGIAKNIDYVDVVLHKDLSLFREMLDHAESLRNPTDANKEYDYAAEAAATRFTEKELLLVEEYLCALEQYITGVPFFDSVYKAAANLLKTKPIPDSAKIPDTEFYRELSLARQIV